MNTTWPFPYRFIAIEGNIGAGKTTLCEKIASTYDCRLILEQFTDNPFLPHFYQNRERYAFPLELFFMTERHKQLQEQLGLQSLFQDAILSDYFFIKTLLFARHNLHAEEFRLFQRLFKVLNNSFPNPDLLVYLHRPVPALLDNIQKRSRDFETTITEDYLHGIQHAYLDYFRSSDGLPIVIIELDDLDFQDDPFIFQALLKLLEQRFDLGITRLSLSRKNDPSEGVS